MKLNRIKNAQYIGEFILRENGTSKNLIKMKYAVTKDIIRNKEPRIYIFTSNDVVMKIGGSGDKSGLKGTIGFYENALTGNPGIRAFVCHHLIHRELKARKRVRVYAIFSRGVKHEITTLNGKKKVMIYSFFREIERACIEEYLDMQKERIQPPWNFQERKKSYPDDLQDEFNKFKNKKSSKKKTNAKRSPKPTAKNKLVKSNKK